MASNASCWKNGSLVWSVEHDSNKGIKHLSTKGNLPDSFQAIRTRHFEEQDSDKNRYKTADGETSADYIFDIPIEQAKELTGFRHDEESGAEGDAFEELVSTGQNKNIHKMLNKKGWDGCTVIILLIIAVLVYVSVWGIYSTLTLGY